MAMRLWPGLLAARLVLVLPTVMCVDLKAPVLIGCVFIHRANITCFWKPGDSDTTNYTLNVRRIIHSSERLWKCTTPSTNCTVAFTEESVNFNFCVSVTAYNHLGNVTSKQRCQPGINEVKLHPVELKSIKSLDAKSNKSKCLNLTWNQTNDRFLISRSQIKGGELESQIEFKADGQPGVRVSNVSVTSKSFVACVFSPDTQYSVKLRHRYRNGTGPWSEWSNHCEGKTAEGAPSTGPMFWRQVIHQDGHRLTSLLWKPLPHALANGRVLSYNITCRDENAKALQDKGNCTNLNISHTSCVLKLPLGPCYCSISASTSVGTSPKAWIWLSKAFTKDPPPPNLLSVNAVNDTSLVVKWNCLSAAAASPSGFIVEWFVVTQGNNSPLHWERVNSSTSAVIISEGVEPFKRCAVSVRALFGRRGSGQSRTEFVYTRQGVPSAGPNVNVHTLGTRVTVTWSLPVEKQRGLIRNYTLFYQTDDQPAKHVILPSTADHYSLVLSPGHHWFWMRASTEAGAGVYGPRHSVNISPEEISVVLCVLLPIGLISLMLIVSVCVAQSKIVKEKLFQEIPNPSHSTMAQWSPKTMTEMMTTQPDITYSEAVLLSDRGTENYELEIDLEMCSYLSTPTRYCPFKCESKYNSGADMTNTNFSSCPVIYTVALVSNAEPKASSSSELQQRSYPGVRHYKQPQEGVSERCHLTADVIHAPFYQMQLSDTGFNVNTFTSTSLFESDSFSQTEPMQLHSSFPSLPATNSLFMDMMNLSPSSVQFDPYLPV